MTENENIKKIHGPYYRSDGRRHIVIVYENGHKQTKSYPKYLLEQKIYKFICPVCKKESEKPMKDVSNNWKMGKKGPVCSKQCAGFVDKEFIRYRTTYEYDSVNKQLTITEESWELP